MPNGGRGGWNRGGRGGGTGRGPPGRYGPGEIHGNKKDSPLRKQKQPGRLVVARKPAHSVNREPDSVDESFEDLLSKYKQIQQELECIRKEETKALEPKDHTANITETRPGPEPVPYPDGLDQAQGPTVAEEQSELEKNEKKVFQAFNIKPLRQKLPAPISLDEPQKKGEELQEGGDAAPGDTDHEVKGEEQQRTTADAAESGQKAEEESMEVRNKKKTTTCVCCSEESDKEDISQHKCLLHRESSGSSDESVIFIDQPVVEEEELSELQLRLLALQSASKKWQQKEQQVMKKSKDRITKGVQDKTSNAAVVPGRQRVTTRSAAAAERSRTRPKPLDRDRDRIKTGPRPADRDWDRLPERDRTKACPKVGPKAPPDRGRALGRGHMTKKMISPGSAAKQAFRKQQLRTWKLQQQREQEEKRRQEEDERRKREDEIRRIRDLSNQDEQYNRFMKLVGGRTRTPSKSTDREHRKSAGKQGLDASGNLYQYDNYDEVAMDTDSETGSPVASPSHSQLSAEHPAGFNQSLYNDCTPFGLDFSQPFLPPLLSGVPPPPPPLPPPPDELEPPPKPPFADEEEEEEMLLRETCLMSMANKRVNTAEEKSSSSPASPDRPPAPALHQPIRGNLSTVSLNTVSQSRSKFTRGHHAARTPLLLPRHKSVVVSLNDSDDSDSDLDACSSTQTAFGGLEFMIKEARRTVEAAKPKAASGSEKENNPVRTPEALPEAKRVEYRLLKEEIASREKQKLLKEHSLSPRTSSSPAVSVSDTNPSGAAAAELRLSEAEQRLNKHRELLQRDEAVLRQLLQQELRKRESLKAAEAKVSKLREQLQASEKIVSANRTLLKKLQEQVHRVEHRVSIKKSQEARLEQELTQAQLLPVRGSKRRADSNQTVPRKLQHVDGTPRGSERQFAELIAQKQRLQQLESEYALKIQKLKQAQALRNRGVTPPELPLDPPLLPSSEPLEPQNQHQPPTAPFNVPQPSLHDLTQDKLTLDSEDVPEADNHEAELASSAAAPVRGTRRNSRRQSSSSFTKPNLEQPSATPAKDNSAKPAKVAAGCTPPTDESSGLDVDALQLRHLQQPQLGELLQRELQRLGGHNHNMSMAQVVSVDLDVASIQSGSSELKPVPFGSYHSPLLVFRSYRFSPYYRTKEKLSLSSVTYSNIIDPKTCFCRFDLTGTCNDDDCRWQHMRNWTLTGNQLFQDLLSYNLSLISCSENSSDEDIRVATEKYMKKLFGPNKDRMGIDQKAVLLVSKVNESKRHVPPFTTCKDMRRWRPKPSGQSSCNHEEDSEDECGAKDLMSGNHEGVSRTSLSAMDVCVTSDDKRYFISETDDISNLESSVLESPRDTQLWIKLAFKYLNQNETSAAECLEAALNTLSRALESNCDDPEIWSHYLMLFSRRGSREEVQEMCEMAVEHAPNYQVWWNYLKLESSFEGKDYVCERLLQFLLSEASSEVTDRVSFQLMEALLYRVHLNLFTGRMESALAILQNALKSAVNRSVAEHLTAGDRALLWLSYIHLTEFDWLPSSLFNPADSGPSRLVSRESFLLPWRTQQDVRTPHNTLIALFQDAVHQCSDGSLSQSERTLACLPLHTNLIFLYRLLDRFDEGVSLCESLLATCPESCLLRDALADLHIRRGDGDRAVSMWLHALAECPNNAEVFYHSCTFLMAQDKTSAIVPLFRGFILSLCEEQQTQGQPVDVLRHVLGFPTVGLLRGPILRELQEQLSQQMPYLHLIHCRWQWLHGSVDDTVDAFERALGSAMKLEELHKLWMDYLVFSSSQRPKLFLDLVHRCLSTIPSRLEFPFNPAEFWSCYSFHNQVVRFYLSCLPQSQHALVLERLRYAMPNNTELGLRFLQQEWQDGNMEHLRFQVRMLSSNAPRCLAYWKIAIAVESELKAPSEVRLLYQQALNNLPLCAVLWKHRLLFESEGGGGGGAGRSDRLRRLLDRCQQVGVSLNQKMSDAHSQSAAGQTQTQ